MTSSSRHRPVAVYGWGVVAPGAEDVREFAEVIARGESALTLAQSQELGHGLFAIGDPKFDFERYRPWVVSRSGDPKFNQLKTKLGDNALFAIGATIQALESNVGLERVVRELDVATHVYIGSGVGDLTESYAAHDTLARTTREWNRFWADRARCAARRTFEDEQRAPSGEPPPADPASLAVDSEARRTAVDAWNAYWAAHSDALRRFEQSYAENERIPVGDDLERGPLHAIKARQRAHRTLIETTGCPEPPWECVDPRLVWAIQNVPAAQVSMLLDTHGPAWAPVGACSTFGVALKLARDAIDRGEAKAVIVGTTDPRPDPALISAFHRARLTPATGNVNLPLTSLLGTHVSGGSCVWIVGDVEFMKGKGLEPIGPRIAGVALSSDAEHIITPSPTGPKHAIREALREADAAPDRVAAWDLHATGTPGDVSELKLVREFVGACTAISARKGLLGHGMSNSGGWELTALALGMMRRLALATGVGAERMHPALRAQYEHQLVTRERSIEAGVGVKVMLGIGGITACVALETP